jgi:hypothetical protein
MFVMVDYWVDIFLGGGGFYRYCRYGLAINRYSTVRVGESLLVVFAARRRRRRAAPPRGARIGGAAASHQARGEA